MILIETKPTRLIEVFGEQEYFYNDGERLHALLGNRFLQKVDVTGEVPAELSELCDLDSAISSVTPFQVDRR